MTRWTRFLIIFIVGISLGLVYAWVIDPLEYIDTVPTKLREDYRADYVLMVAEVYNNDGDEALAIEQLKFIGEENIESNITDAIIFASQSGYAHQDLSLLRDLSDALQDLVLENDVNTP